MSSESSEPVSPARRALPIVLKIAVSAILLAFLLRSAHVGDLWAQAKSASLPWLGVALGFYFVNVLFSIWRWSALLVAQDVHVPVRKLLGSYLVALFFNNFLPSNIGGDVIRIKDTAPAARSRTLATMVVLTDRVIGLLVLILIAAVGATMVSGGLTAGRVVGGVPIWPAWLWVGFALVMAVSAPAVLAPAGVARLLQPLTVLHPEWVGGRIENLTATLTRFRAHPGALVAAFTGAILVQGAIVVFYFVIAYALGIDVSIWHIAVIVPISFVIQMLPISMNGLGVREATFGLYFAQIGLTRASGLLLSLSGAALMMVFSLIGAPVYVSRRH